MKIEYVPVIKYWELEEDIALQYGTNVDVIEALEFQPNVSNHFIHLGGDYDESDANMKLVMTLLRDVLPNEEWVLIEL